MRHAVGPQIERQRIVDATRAARSGLRARNERQRRSSALDAGAQRAELPARTPPSNVPLQISDATSASDRDRASATASWPR